jgi:hypothetical protein
MEDIFRTLPKVLREAEDAAPLREALVLAAWKHVAGDSLSKNALPAKLDEKRLIIAVQDEMWERHLRALSGQVIFQLNGLLGAETVTFIDFVVDRSFFTAINEERFRLAREKKDFESRSKAEITPRIEAAAGEIEDPLLRKLFLQAAGNCLVRKKDLYS